MADWAHTLRSLAIQADACRELGSPMYGDLLDRLGADLAAGGPTATVLRGHEEDPGPSALGLRLLGSVHRLVLQRRAGALAAYYPSVGGTWEAEGAWSAFRELLAAQPETVREWLDQAPQTNEVGRAAALYGGLCRLGEDLPGDLPVRLFEIGASGGLNLRADRFGYRDVEGRRFGDPAASLVLDGAWTGRSLAGCREPRVVERVGGDLAPVDPTTTQGRLVLTAYVWPDQPGRFERLRRALDVAARVPAQLRREDAVSFVTGLRLREGATTVLWHSVMWQYLTARDQAAVTDRLDALGAEATASAPLAHLFLEPTRPEPGAEHRYLVVSQTWPGGRRRVLGEAAPHGVPVTWG